MRKAPCGNDNQDQPVGVTSPVQPRTSNAIRPKGERSRKLIHVSSAVLPILAWQLPRPYALVLLGLVAGLAVVTEWARRRVRCVRYRFLIRTRRMLRPRERRAVSGATYMSVGYFAVLLIFPKAIAVAAMLYVCLGDAAGTMVGSRWGKYRMSSGKSLEGAAAEFLVNVAIGLTIPTLGVVAALVGGLAATTLEISEFPLDDNLRVSLGGATALWLVGAFTSAAG
jgi:dolichol kinase